MPPGKKIVVIGGGIAGLCAALEISGFSGGRKAGTAKVEIAEASDRLGGAISTVRKDGFVMERGPDSLFADKETLEFCSKIGIASRLLGTSKRDRKVFIMENGRTVPLPDGFFMITPGKIAPFLASPLFSLRCKLRTLAEVFIPARPASEGEESVASFVRRRFGDEILRKAAGPLVGGIYSASAEVLGAESVLSEFVRMEREKGSVLLSALRTAKGEPGESGGRFGRFFSPKGGMSEIVEAVFKNLPEGCVRMNFRVSSIMRKENRWEIVSADGERIEADAVIAAVPCRAAASMLAETDAGLSRLLGSVRHSSCAVANLAYKTAEVPGVPPGFGLIVADAGEGEVFACSFLSRKFANRAPDGFSIIRFFAGGDELCGRGDDEIISLAEKFAETMFGALNPPLSGIAGKYPAQMPVYGVGHKGFADRIMNAAESLGGLFFAGAAYGGVGIPDCISNGRKAGRKAAEYCSDLRNMEITG